MTPVSQIELFVLDMDGTVYLGDNLLPNAVEFVKAVRKKGKKAVFFTNNASKNPDIYLNKLNRMGFEVKREDIVTAGDVTIDWLNRFHKGEKVYLVGTPALEKCFIENGIQLSNDASIVVSSFDTTLTYEKLVIACDLIRNGALFLSTHQDFNCPTETGFIPDSGAICALITASTGKTPRYFGKPNSETADMLSNLFAVERSKTAMIGDRLYTDIAFGKQNGILSILVLTGETKPEDITPENKADITVDGIGDLISML